MQAAFILGEYVTSSDITLSELQTKLAAHDVHVGTATLSRFFERRASRLKKPPMQTSRNGPT